MHTFLHYSNISMFSLKKEIKMDPSLYDGLMRGDLDKLKQLEEEKLTMNRIGVTARQNTVLHICAGLGYTSIVNATTDHDLLFTVNSKGDTVLHCAARAGQESAVTYLVDMMTTLNGNENPLQGMWNSSGNTPLHEAVRNCHLQSAYELIRRNPQLGQAVNMVGESPVYIAVERGTVRIARMLLQFSNCAVSGPNGQTALHAAVCRNYGIAELLLKIKPDLNHKVDATGSSPLHYAASIGDMRMVQLLLTHDATTVHILDRDGLSPIHVAAILGYTDVIAELIKHCPDAVELINAKGRNILHIAIENKRLKVVKYVLRNCAFTELINEPDNDGNTPLHLAIISHNLQVVNLLLADKRVDTRARNLKGLTPLDLAYLCVNSSIRLRMHKIIVKLVSARSQFSPLRADYLMTNKCPRENDEQIDRCRALVNNLAIVAVLIATIAFSAAFTLPGGYRSDDSSNEGMAILGKKMSFKAFLLADAIAMVSSLIVTCLLIYSGSLDHDIRLHCISTAMKFLWVALVGMVVAFAMGIYAVVSSDCEWLAVLICFMACSVPFIAWIITCWPTFNSLKLMNSMRDQGKIVKRSATFEGMDFQMPDHMVADFQTPHDSETESTEL